MPGGLFVCAARMELVKHSRRQMRDPMRNHTLTRWGILLASALLLCSPVGMPSPAWAVTDFATFEFKKLKIKDKDREFKDKLDLRGTFTLGAESDGIDPVHEAVIVNIEGEDRSTVFTQYIPPGSFERDEDDDGDKDKDKDKDKGKDDDTEREDAEFEFEGEKERGRLKEFKIEAKGNGRYEFRIKGNKLQFACCLPTTITFIIGDDGGALDRDTRAQVPLDTVLPVSLFPLEVTLEEGATVSAVITPDTQQRIGLRALRSPLGSALFASDERSWPMCDCKA